MKIEIEIKDEFIDTTANGLRLLARRNDREFKSDKKGKELIGEVLFNLCRTAHGLTVSTIGRKQAFEQGVKEY